MKKLLFVLFLIIALSCQFSFAQVKDFGAYKISATQGKIVGQSFLKAKINQWNNAVNKKMLGETTLSGYSIPNNLLPIVDSGDTLAYCENLSPEGYIIISTDSRITPIIAYSLQGKFDTTRLVNNIAYDMLVTDMKLRRKALIDDMYPKELTDKSSKTWNDLLSNNYFLASELQAWPNEYSGWTNTQWGQGELPRTVENDSCPDDPNTDPALGTSHTDDGKCLTGCVATAMGQIVNFWGGNTGKPTAVTFTSADNYRSELTPDPDDGHHTRVIDPVVAQNANFSSMTYPATGEKIADLLFACGVSVHMNYSDIGSSVGSLDSVPTALTSKFDFTEATVKYSDFYDTLKSNMKEGMPAQLAIFKSGKTSGHSIICDGYKVESAEDKYHVNYGWYGQYQASTNWYALPTGLPADYSIVDHVVVNIRQNVGIEKVISSQLVQSSSGKINIQVKAPVTGNYYVQVFNENLQDPLDWNWSSSTSAGLCLVSGAVYTFSLDVIPTSANATFQFWLYKESWIAGKFVPIGRMNKTLTALPPDNTAPTIQIIAPSNGTSVVGTVSITADINDFGSGIDHAELYVNNVLLQNFISSPYTFDWNTDPLAIGSYTIMFKAFDNAGNSAEQSTTVTKSDIALYAGAITPASGTTDDTFNFEVYYKSTANQSPDGNMVTVYCDGTPYAMTNSGTSWSSGVKFAYSKNGFSASTHQYYFTTSANGKNLRYPESGSISFNVTQSVAGWDLAINTLNTSYSPSTITPGTNITVHCYVKNQSIAGKTYTNVPLWVELYDSAGTLKDSHDTTIASIASGDLQQYDLTLYCPTNAANGLWSIVVTVLTGIDSNPSNNSYTMKFYIGPPVSADQYVSNAGDVTITSSTPTTPPIWINGLAQFNFYDMISGKRAWVDGDWGRVSIDTSHIFFSLIDPYKPVIALVDCWYDSYYSMYYYEYIAGTVTTSGPQFLQREMIARPGDTVIFKAAAPNGLLFNGTVSKHKIFTTGTSINVPKSWFFNVKRNAAKDTASFYFAIPKSATTHEYPFTMSNGYQTTTPIHLTELRIVVKNPPIITRISKTSISADDTLKMSGRNFTTTIGKVTFGSINATSIIQWKDTLITCIVPHGITSGNVYVTAKGEISNGMAFIVISPTGNPEVISHIPDQTMNAQSTKFICNLDNIFWDPNGQKLTDSIVTTGSASIVANLDSLAKGKLYLSVTSNIGGTFATIIKATDPSKASVTDTFLVTVIKGLVPPETPLLLSPTNTSIGVSPQMQLTWHTSSGASSYHLQISKDSSFTVIVLNDSLISDTVRNVTGLEKLTNYYWHAKAINLAGKSSYSLTWKFQTIGGPTVVQLISPPNNSDSIRTDMTFRWHKAIDQTSSLLLQKIDMPSATLAISNYWLEIATDTLDALNFIDYMSLTDTFKVVNGLSNAEKYFWRVKAKNETGWGKFCGWWKFTTSPTGVNETADLPKSYTLYANYPNPFNPSTTIKYGLPQSAYVTLSVYNILGQRVALLVDERQEAGYHEVNFQASCLPSGVYFYRLQAGQYTETKKLLLMK